MGERLNLKLTQECLDTVYLSEQCDAFKINALAYWILSKIVMDTDAYVYVKQEKST